MFASTVLLLRNLQALMFIHSCLLLGLRFHMCTASTVAKEQVRVANDGRFPSELWDVPLKGAAMLPAAAVSREGSVPWTHGLQGDQENSDMWKINLQKADLSSCFLHCTESRVE